MKKLSLFLILILVFTACASDKTTTQPSETTKAEATIAQENENSLINSLSSQEIEANVQGIITEVLDGQIKVEAWQIVNITNETTFIDNNNVVVSNEFEVGNFVEIYTSDFYLAEEITANAVLRNDLRLDVPSGCIPDGESPYACNPITGDFTGTIIDVDGNFLIVEPNEIYEEFEGFESVKVLVLTDETFEIGTKLEISYNNLAVGTQVFVDGIFFEKL